MTYRSRSTIKAEIAQRIYEATGQGIVWAVLDSGIDKEHPHFRTNNNLDLTSPLQHVDFTGSNSPDTALIDENGHGTFVAGIIAGESRDVEVAEQTWDYVGDSEYRLNRVPSIAGIAPATKIVSLKVLGPDGEGKVSHLLAGLGYVQEMNDHGRLLRVHGVCIGPTYGFDPEMFPCGRSPLCIEVDRLVQSGVVVVTASGNTGYWKRGGTASPINSSLEATIADPGNAELAITVGSAHRDLPQLYGVSYFSSRGPTSDGRLKPDLVAPGEHIASSTAGARKEGLKEKLGLDDKLEGSVQYEEASSTSYAAAHVAGAAAALMSVRRELIGRPRDVKAVLMNSAEDIGRTRTYQGSGIPDVYKAIQTGVSREPSTMADYQQTGLRVTDDLGLSPPRSAVPREAEPSASEDQQPLRVMLSYSHRDKAYKEEMERSLSTLRRQGLVEIWEDRQILPGSEFAEDIAKALEGADVILLLISRSFIDSEYCWSKEMKRAVERHTDGTARVVPVILKDSDWIPTPFGKLNALPEDGKPITTWENEDAAWADVSRGMRRVVEDLSG